MKEPMTPQITNSKRLLMPKEYSPIIHKHNNIPDLNVSVSTKQTSLRKEFEKRLLKISSLNPVISLEERKANSRKDSISIKNKEKKINKLLKVVHQENMVPFKDTILGRRTGKSHTTKHQQSVFIEDKNPQIFRKQSNFKNSLLKGSYNEKKTEKNEEIIREMLKARNVYDSMSENEDDEGKGRWLIKIDGKLKFLIDSLIFICTILTLIFCSYFNAFHYSSFWFSLLKNIIDLIFFIDFFRNFFTPFLDQEENLVTDLFNIALNYFDQTMILDLSLSIPFNLLLETNFLGKSSFNSLKWWEWIKIFSLIKLKRNDIIRKLYEFFFSQEGKVSRLIIFIVYFIILVHISSCFWIFIGETYVSRTTNNWITSNNLHDLKTYDIYVASVYFNLVTIYTVGYGDIVSSSVLEILVNSIMLMVGVFLFSYAISNFSTLLTSTDKKVLELEEKIQILEDIRCDFDVDKVLFKSCKKFFQNIFKKAYDERYNLLESLPHKVKNDLMFFIYKNQIKELEFFKLQNHDFILFVLPLLKTMKLRKNEKLYSTHEFVEEMYLVTKGKLSLNFGVNLDEIEICTIQEKSNFGEILLNSNTQSPYILKAKSRNTEVLVLKKSDFIKIKQIFHENILIILQKSYFLLEKIDKRKNLIQSILKIDPNVKSVKQKLIYLNNFLMNRDFDGYFKRDEMFEDEFEFLMKADKVIIETLFQTNEKKSKNSINKNSELKQEEEERVTNILTNHFIQESKRQTLVEFESKSQNQNSVDEKEIKFISESPLKTRNARRDLSQERENDKISVLSDFQGKIPRQSRRKVSSDIKINFNKTKRKTINFKKELIEFEEDSGRKKSICSKNQRKKQRKSLIHLFRKIDVNENHLNFLREESVLVDKTKKLLTGDHFDFGKEESSECNESVNVKKKYDFRKKNFSDNNHEMNNPLIIINNNYFNDPKIKDFNVKQRVFNLNFEITSFSINLISSSKKKFVDFKISTKSFEIIKVKSSKLTNKTLSKKFQTPENQFFIYDLKRSFFQQKDRFFGDFMSSNERLDRIIHKINHFKRKFNK